MFSSNCSQSQASKDITRMQSNIQTFTEYDHTCQSFSIGLPSIFFIPFPKVYARGFMPRQFSTHCWSTEIRIGSMSTFYSLQNIFPVKYQLRPLPVIIHLGSISCFLWQSRLLIARVPLDSSEIQSHLAMRQSDTMPHRNILRHIY